MTATVDAPAEIQVWQVGFSGINLGEGFPGVRIRKFSRRDELINGISEVREGGVIPHAILIGEKWGGGSIVADLMPHLLNMTLEEPIRLIPFSIYPKVNDDILLELGLQNSLAEQYSIEARGNKIGLDGYNIIPVDMWGDETEGIIPKGSFLWYLRAVMESQLVERPPVQAEYIAGHPKRERMPV